MDLETWIVRIVLSPLNLAPEMNTFINLNDQRERKPNKKALSIYFVITIALAIVSMAAILLGEEGSSFRSLGGFYVLYFSVFALSLWMQIKGKHLFDIFGRSYFQFDDNGFEYKLSPFKKRIYRFEWNQVMDMNVKLFVVQIKTREGWHIVDLEKLSDNNLKLVKERFKSKKSELIVSEPISA